MADIKDAIHWWLSENCTRHVESFVPLEALLVHFFSLADSLYYALREEPVEVIGVGRMMADRRIEPIDKELERVELELFGRSVAPNKNIICIVNPLSDKALFRLMGRLALTGEMILVTKKVKELSKRLNERNLFAVLNNHLPNLKKYSHARNFFMHLDERIGKDINEHGVTGELEVPEIGVKFSEDAKGCMYFGFDENSNVYFHDKPRGKKTKASAKSLSFSKQGMSDLFSLVTDLYDLVTSHTSHAHDYPPSGTVYDLG
jgi:hypothetical protein